MQQDTDIVHHDRAAHSIALAVANTGERAEIIGSEQARRVEDRGIERPMHAAQLGRRGAGERKYRSRIDVRAAAETDAAGTDVAGSPARSRTRARKSAGTAGPASDRTAWRKRWCA